MGQEGLRVKKILRLMQKPTPPCTAIVVAAGSSRRMGGVDKLTVIVITIVEIQEIIIFNYLILMIMLNYKIHQHNHKHLARNN